MERRWRALRVPAGAWRVVTLRIRAIIRGVPMMLVLVHRRLHHLTSLRRRRQRFSEFLAVRLRRLGRDRSPWFRVPAQAVTRDSEEVSAGSSEALPRPDRNGTRNEKVTNSDDDDDDSGAGGGLDFDATLLRRKLADLQEMEVRSAPSLRTKSNKQLLLSFGLAAVLRQPTINRSALCRNF